MSQHHLFPHHPYLKQEQRRAVHDANQHARNKLFREGRKVESALSKAIKNTQDELTFGSIAALAKAMGAAESYIEVRKALSPEIATDRLTQMLGGRINIANKIIHGFLSSQEDE